MILFIVNKLTCKIENESHLNFPKVKSKPVTQKEENIGKGNQRRRATNHFSPLNCRIQLL